METITPSIKIAVLTEASPEEVKLHLAMTVKDSMPYIEAKRIIEDYILARRSWSTGTQDNVDVSAIKGKEKGKGKWKGKEKDKDKDKHKTKDTGKTKENGKEKGKTAG